MATPPREGAGIAYIGFVSRKSDTLSRFTGSLAFFTVPNRSAGALTRSRTFGTNLHFEWSQGLLCWWRRGACPSETSWEMATRISQPPRRAIFQYSFKTAMGPFSKRSTIPSVFGCLLFGFFFAAGSRPQRKAGACIHSFPDSCCSASSWVYVAEEAATVAGIRTLRAEHRRAPTL